ncbi:MAG: hypothetical protein JWN84_4107 [Nocardioides sp.]|nr:hypothetical protein [Nocardioides sp.]
MCAIRPRPRRRRYDPPVTPLAVITALAIACCLPDWRNRFPWLLGATLTLPITAAVAVPGLQLTPFFIVALVLSLLVGWAWFRQRIALFSWPGSTLLLAFSAWTAVITLAGPALWAGITVINNRAEAGGVPAPVALAYTGSNVAQPAYLALSVVIICFLASRPQLSTHILLPGLVGSMGLSFWRLLSDRAGLWFPTSLVDSGTYGYIDINTATAYRLRGVFTEPSTLAHYATAALALCLVMLYSGQRFRAVYGLLAVVSAVNIVFAQSGTALVGGLAVLGLTSVMLTVRALRTGRGLSHLAVAACFTGVAVLVFFPVILEYASNLFSNKVDSDSYERRTASDVYSLQLFVDVYGTGVGLGSNKPSSLWPMLLSTVGVVGTVLFAAVCVTLVWRAARTTTWLGAATVVTSVVVTKSVAGSFLCEPLLVLGLACCAHAAARGRPQKPGYDQTPGRHDHLHHRGSLRFPVVAAPGERPHDLDAPSTGR